MEGNGHTSMFPLLNPDNAWRRKLDKIDLNKVISSMLISVEVVNWLKSMN